MPTFDIPQDIIDEWICAALEELSDEDNVSWQAGRNDGYVLTVRAILSQLGIKVPHETHEQS